MRKKLKLDSLNVTSFETSAVAVGTSLPTIDTQQLDCMSPWCAPTFGRTCDCAA
jgi:hypothetical protein